jgi:DNA invertase Pin-like site-specific DNA recombinase
MGERFSPREVTSSNRPDPAPSVAARACTARRKAASTAIEPPCNECSEKKSGANSDRAALQRMLKEVGPGDIVVVTRLDRLAGSVRHLLNILERFGQDDVGFQSLREKHIDTTSAGGRLVLNIMASIAEFERKLIQA